VQRPDRTRRRHRGIEPIGFLPCARVDGLDRVERRAGLVVRLDALQIQLD
jgi:hypothetical protein